MQASVLDQGIMLMLVGMGTVFVFLSLLVAAMAGMAAIIGRRGPVADDVPTDDEIAAIAAALAAHRDKHS